jgi:hypothetical protein
MLSLVATEGQAARRVELQVHGDLPFSARQLIDMVRARLPVVTDDGPPTRVVVRARGDIEVGVVEIRVDDRVEQLRPTHGAEGARTVALLVIDILPEDQGHHAHLRPVQVADRDCAAPTVTVKVATRPAEPWLELSAAPLMSWLAYRGAAFEPTATLALRVRSWIWSWLELGFVYADGVEQTTVQQLPIRAGLAVRGGWLEARIGAALRPFWISGEGGLQRGLTAALRFNGLGRRVGLFVTAGVDVFLRHREHLESVVPWIGLGVTFRGGG